MTHVKHGPLGPLTTNPRSTPMTTSAYHAVHAARHVNSWGLFAARRYCERRAVHPRLFMLARQLQAASSMVTV